MPMIHLFLMSYNYFLGKIAVFGQSCHASVWSVQSDSNPVLSSSIKFSPVMNFTLLVNFSPEEMCGVSLSLLISRGRLKLSVGSKRVIPGSPGGTLNKKIVNFLSSLLPYH